MSNFIISIIGNKIFSEIINEIKLFSKFKIKYYDNIDLCIEDNTKENKLFIFFNNYLKINSINQIIILKNYNQIIILKNYYN